MAQTIILSISSEAHKLGPQRAYRKPLPAWPAPSPVPSKRGTLALLQGTLQGTFRLNISSMSRLFAGASHPLLPYR
jgi:hypothetical protein